MEPRSHIVVVEDEATQRQLLGDYLTRQNFRVTGVDGGIALRKLFERDVKYGLGQRAKSHWGMRPGKFRKGLSPLGE